MCIAELAEAFSYDSAKFEINRVSNKTLLSHYIETIYNILVIIIVITKASLFTSLC